jgi:TonB-linked SusC/RagA family outer membrane protein
MKKKSPYTKFLWKFMKTSIKQLLLMVWFSSLALANDSKAQEVLNQSVTIVGEQLELRQVLGKIEKQTNIKFVYSTKIKSDQKLSLKIVDSKLSTVLDELLNPIAIDYEVIGNRILLKKKKELDRPLEKKTDELLVEANTFKISGKVTDENGLALVGASILLKGTTTGTITDAEGKYVISIPDGSVQTGILVFSYIGYSTIEKIIGNQAVIDVSMQSDVKALQDIVVVGYGTVKKSDLTGSVASVGEKNIKATPIVALDRAMQGRAAGVLVTQNSASPGGSVTVRIRGTGSVNASNEPLYVIDGFPTTGGLNTINPNDIESMEILKDASATAIYGSRGSNGVVMITTKRGKSGQSNIDFESYYGVQQITRKIPLLNAQEYATFINEARVNGGGQTFFDGSAPNRPTPQSLGAGTDWQNEVFHTAPIQNYQLTFSGGENKTRYAISGNYFKQDGIILNSSFERYSLRANIDREISDKLKIGTSLLVSRTKSIGARTETDGGANSGVTNAAINFAPTFPVYNTDGTYYKDQSQLNGNLVDNPVALAQEITNQNYNTRILANFFLDYKIVEGLSFRTSFGGDLNNGKANIYFPRTLILGQGARGDANISASQNTNLLNENTLTYSKKILKHNLTALLGYTIQTNQFENFGAAAQGFNDDFATFNNLGGGATLRVPNSFASKWGLVSYLARVNYDYDGRFLITATARRDGSSRFGQNNKFGFFPSGSVAWRIINEKFMQNLKTVSDLKIRASYGLTGNQEIGDYRFLASIVNNSYVFGNNLSIGSVPNGLTNQDLKWEKNAQFDIGIDIGFLNDRIQLTADYYIKNTSDLLFNVNIPVNTGYANALRNIGSVQNKGWELSISTVNIDKAFKWTSELNLSGNQNQITNLDGRPEFTAGDGSGHLQVFNTVLLKVGEPLGSFYGRVTNGIFQTGDDIAGSAQPTARAGDRRFVDLNGDRLINDLDRAIIGNGIPKFFGGLNNTFSYKGIELNIFLQGSYGNKILNFGNFDLFNLNGNNNQSAEVLNRWTPSNPSNTIPRAVSTGGQRILSDAQVEDGSYLRVKNISLSYTLPASILKATFIKNIRVYVATQNWFTFTKYSGYDPEVSRFGQTSISQGMDYGGYPNSKTFLLGLNAKF